MTTPPPSTEENHPRRRTLLLTAGAVVFVLAASYVGLALFTGERVPGGTTVADVGLGGLGPQEAEERVRTELGPRAEQPIVAVVDDERYRIDPDAAGLRLNVSETVEAAHGTFSLNPARVFHAIFGGQQVDPVVEVDEEALSETVGKVAKQANQPPRDGAIAFADGEAEVTTPEKGMALDRSGAADAVREAFLADGGPVELPTREASPRVGADDVDQAMSEFVEPALSGPVAVDVGDGSFEITPEQLTQALSMQPVDGGQLEPSLGPKKLANAVEDELAEVETSPSDATVRIEGGQPTVVDGERGRRVKPAELSESVFGVLSQQAPKDRSVELEMKRVAPDLTTEDVDELGIQEVVGEFTTNYPHAEYRNINIGRAAELIDGTMLEPDEEFSLNGLVGERTEGNGFTSGSVIEGGRLVNALGGGVSQLATTTYNAAFFAGMEDVEHRPHAFYIGRYPQGREATVYWGSIDLRFRNNTPHGVLVDAQVNPSTPGSEGSVTVRLWSTEYWQVEEQTSDRYNYRAPETIYDPSDGCVAQAGSSGFDVDFTRRLLRDGELVDTEEYSWAYQAEDQVICAPEPSDEDDEDDGDDQDDGD